MSVPFIPIFIHDLHFEAYKQLHKTDSKQTQNSPLSLRASLSVHPVFTWKTCRYLAEKNGGFFIGESNSRQIAQWYLTAAEEEE